jgi:tripartite-type tricarboxylate transporter receptor subunit TctC
MARSCCHGPPIAGHEETFMTPNAPSLPRRRHLLAAGAALPLMSLAGLWPAGQAQAQPAPPTVAPGSWRLLCSGPPGSIPDIVARRYAETLGARGSRPLVVDNRPGAAGQLAVGVLRQAGPEAPTLLLGQGALSAVYPYLYPRLAYDPATDLQAVSVAAEATLGLAVGPAVPERVQTLPAWLEWMAANPAAAQYGSPGLGTLPHLVSAMLARRVGANWTHVPYPGGPQAMVDLLGGRLTALVLPEGLLRPHLQAGKLRVLATSGAQRSAFLPQVPTFVEQGQAGLVVREWFAFFSHGGAPQETARQVAAEVQAAAADAALRTALGDLGMVAVASTPAEMAQRISTEQRYWQTVLKETGIRAEA